MYWASGDDRRIFASVDQYVYALDARDGKADPVVRRERPHRSSPRSRPRAQTQNVRLTSPGVIYRGLLIVGGRVNEGLPGSPGHIRAYDVRTGKLRWIFHTIPHPGEAGLRDVVEGLVDLQRRRQQLGRHGARRARAASSTCPPARPSDDFYGANRLGDNLYANSLIALNAETGKRIWHFQVVRHDIWDRDLPSPPSLVTRDGATAGPIDAVAQTTKHGYVFLFDRVDRQAALPDRVPEVPGERRAGRGRRRHAADPDAAGAVLAAAADRRAC